MVDQNQFSICFTKHELFLRFCEASPSRSMATFNSLIQRALKRRELLQLKKGLYITMAVYLQELDKRKLSEYIASQLYEPSYISLEYVLEKHHLLFRDEAAGSITSITTKTGRTFTNFSGSYVYSNVKSSIYFGFEEVDFHGQKYHIATKAKALFDYFYMDSTLDYRNEKHLRHQLFEELHIQWANFSEKDFQKFNSYVWGLHSFKMMAIRRVMERYFEGKKLNGFAKVLLAERPGA